MTEILPPPVPADCDLRDLRRMPLDVRAVRDSRAAAKLDGAAFRAATLLWCAAWHQVPASSLPDDDDELAMLAGFGKDRDAWRRVRAAALHGFAKYADGRLYHLTIAEAALEEWNRPAPPLRRPSEAAWNRLRAAAFTRDGYTCRYCGRADQPLECDHVIPISRGGSNQLRNLATACRRCNRSKRDRTVQEWRST